MSVFQMLDEMEYGPAIDAITLAHGEYKGHQFKVWSHGTHPTAYVSVQNGKALNTNDIDCHGGVTWNHDHLPDTDPEGDIWWIGWDYAHFGDFLWGRHAKSGKKWTRAEIVNECMHVIDQLESENG